MMSKELLDQLLPLKGKLTYKVFKAKLPKEEGTWLIIAIKQEEEKP